MWRRWRASVRVRGWRGNVHSAGEEVLASYWTQRCLEGGKGWNALLAVLGLTYSSFPPHHSVAVTH